MTACIVQHLRLRPSPPVRESANVLTASGWTFAELYNFSHILVAEVSREPSAFVLELEYITAWDLISCDASDCRRLSIQRLIELLGLPDISTCTIVPRQFRGPPIMVGCSTSNAVAIVSLSMSHTEADIVMTRRKRGLDLTKCFMVAIAIKNSQRKCLPFWCT